VPVALHSTMYLWCILLFRSLTSPNDNILRTTLPHSYYLVLFFIFIIILHVNTVWHSSIISRGVILHVYAFQTILQTDTVFEVACFGISAHQLQLHNRIRWWLDATITLIQSTSKILLTVWLSIFHPF
jgi:hypothetical protein